MIQMTIDPELLKILACPITHQSLRLLEPAELEQINQLIDSREIKNGYGETVINRWNAGLIREDKRRAYQIENDLPLLIGELGIELTT